MINITLVSMIMNYNDTRNTAGQRECRYLWDNDAITY